VISAYTVATVTDVLITIVMSGLLLSKRSGIKRTDRLLANIAITSINTGSWTVINALLTVILTVATSKSTYIFAIPNLSAAPLYVNTVLCNLNVRQFFRDQEAETSFQFSTVRIINLFRREPRTRHASATRDTEDAELPTIRIEGEQDRNEFLNVESKTSTKLGSAHSLKV